MATDAEDNNDLEAAYALFFALFEPDDRVEIRAGPGGWARSASWFAASDEPAAGASPFLRMPCTRHAAMHGVHLRGDRRLQFRCLWKRGTFHPHRGESAIALASWQRQDGDI
jgi:hypothetical protein